MKMKWLLVGVALSLGLHFLLLDPLGSRTVEEAVEPTPVLATLPIEEVPEQPPEPPATDPQESPQMEQTEPNPLVEPELQLAMEEEPPAPSVTEPDAEPDLLEEPPAPTELVRNVEAPEFIEEATVDPATPSAPVASGSPVVVPRTLQFVQQSARSTPTEPEPVTIESRTRAVMASRPEPSTVEPTSSAVLPAADEVARRIEAMRRAASNPSPVSNPADGDHASTQNGRPRPTPRIQWGDIEAWRSVSRTGGLLLVALGADGAPAALIRESGGTWGRSPLPASLNGYSIRVRIVDHVALFRPARPMTRAGERLAILIPRSLEGEIQRSMDQAIRRNDLDPDVVSICEGVLVPRDGRLEFVIQTFDSRNGR